MKHVKLFVALFAMIALGVTNAWGETATLSNANIAAKYDSQQTGYRSITDITDDSGHSYSAYAILNQHSKATSTNKYLQIKKYADNTAYYVQVPQMPGNITSISMTVSSSSKSMTDGGNTNTLYFSSSNQTSATGTGVASGTGAKSVTIDCSSLNLTEGFITAGGAVRIWDITITYETSGSGGEEPETPEKTATSLVWSAAEYTATIGADNTYPTLTTEPVDLAGVTYASSNTAAATIAADGTITLVAAGTTTITASYAGNEIYVAATDATYTLTVEAATPDPEEPENPEDAQTYDFTNINGFTEWGSSYSKHEVTYSDAVVTFAFANQNSQTITDQPVTKGGDVSLVLTDGMNIATVKWVCTKWGSKTQTITLHYSKDGGKVYTSTEITSSDFTISSDNLPAGTNAVKITFSSSNNQVGIKSCTITKVEAAAITQVPAPKFSLPAGAYTEAQEVTLSAEAETIYYTLDGTTPNAESTAYNEPIVLNECGTTTIKAIAISGETTSSVASATYTIKLPLNNSQSNPYTEAEAIEVYDGGCYDNQEVYVKGVVANAQFYGNSNTYTITLEGGFQFYKFYEAAGEATFTEDYIVAGDTLVACGKLVKFNTTYELGAGCYLVERKPYSAPKVDISNTPETAYTVAEAIALIDDITSDLTKGVYVKGQISEVESFNDYYGSITYWIKDEEGNTFQCYSGLGLNSEKFASVDDLVVGSQVVVYGTLKKHNSTYELDKNNYIVSLTLPSYTVTVTVNDAAFGSVQGLAAEGKYEHGAEATLTAVANDGYKFIGWTSGEDTVSIENPYTFTVTANVALVANFKEVETETVYFVNNQGWENVNVYAWTTVPNAEWPGVAATKETEQICGYDVYSYTAEAGAYAAVIFNNGNDHQTADLVWTAGKYYVQNGWYTREEAEALLAGTDIPSVITYVLRGVGGDWTVGIALTANQDNENEYVLLGQDIAEGDAVKVVTLTDGVATAYCGKVDEYSVAHSFDGDGNIVLAPGKYNFYFKVNEDLIYIAAVNPGPATALENIAVEGKAVKAIVNGQLIIIKNGVLYNAQGQVIK